MRAKFKVDKVERHEVSELLTLSAVGANSYPEDGTNEDNDFARWSPFGVLQMSVNNPNLLGVIQEGEKYYLNFEKAEE